MRVVIDGAMGMKISFIIPTLNVGSSYLERAIKSITNQYRNDIEIIVMDGGSDDDTVDAIKRNAADITYWESRKDGGAHFAFGNALEHINGDYICMIGGTDWIGDDIADSVMRKMDAHKADVYYGDVCIVSKNGGYQYVKTYTEDLDQLYYKSVFCTIGTYVRTNLVKKVWELNDNRFMIADDVFMWGTLHKLGKRFCYVDSGSQLANFTLGGVSNTQTYRVAQDVRAAQFAVINDSPMLMDKYKDLIEKEYAYKVSKEIINNTKNDALVRALKTVLKLDIQSDCLVYGAGEDGRDCIELLSKIGIKIRGVLDSDVGKHGTYLKEYKVLSPDLLKSEEASNLIIGSYKYEKEIKRYLNSMGLSDRIRIDSYSDILMRLVKCLEN